MTIMYMMCNSLGVDSYQAKDARRHLRQILAAADHGRPSVITRYGEPTAVVVPATWYEDARDAFLVAEHLLGRDKDDAVPWEQVKAELGIDGERGE